MKRYHRNVEDGILEFGRRRRFPHVNGDNVPLHINHPFTRKQILYRPDAHFITRHGKLVIFEVLDDEIGDDNLVIADIIQAFLTPNVLQIFFIVPVPNDQDHVKELAVTIYATLVNMGVPERNLKDVRTLYIARSEARSARRVANLLARLVPARS